jgi:hypothetical protein
MMLGKEVALGQMQIRTADSAHVDPEPNLALFRSRHLSLYAHQRMGVDRARGAHSPCLHRRLMQGPDVATPMTFITRYTRSPESI